LHEVAHVAEVHAPLGAAAEAERVAEEGQLRVGLLAAVVQQVQGVLRARVLAEKFAARAHGAHGAHEIMAQP